jgi:hypothetical protein
LSDRSRPIWSSSSDSPSLSGWVDQPTSVGPGIHYSTQRPGRPESKRPLTIHRSSIPLPTSTAACTPSTSIPSIPSIPSAPSSVSVSSTCAAANRRLHPSLPPPLTVSSIHPSGRGVQHPRTAPAPARQVPRVLQFVHGVNGMPSPASSVGRSNAHGRGSQVSQDTLGWLGRVSASTRVRAWSERAAEVGTNAYLTVPSSLIIKPYSSVSVSSGIWCNGAVLLALRRLARLYPIGPRSSSDDMMLSRERV